MIQKKQILMVMFISIMFIVGFGISGMLLRSNKVSADETVLKFESTNVLQVDSSSSTVEITEIYESPSEINNSTNCDDPVKPWYQISRFVVHAAGIVDGERYTNSREALESTLLQGNLLVEIDFRFTTDNYLVCVHEWKDFFGYDRSCDLKLFLDRKVRGKFSGLTGKDIISYMEEYPSLYVIVDTKEKDSSLVIDELLRLCDNRPDIADRFVIQLYDQGEKEKIMELYPFKNENFLFTCYKFGAKRVDEILKICREEKISVITVPYERWDQETIDLFLNEGYILFEHTVNSASMVESSIQKGIYGFYTDCVQENDLAG